MRKNEQGTVWYELAYILIRVVGLCQFSSRVRGVCVRDYSKAIRPKKTRQKIVSSQIHVLA